MSGERLAVVLDGAPLAPEAARALWTEFSAHMDANKGDLKGFAQAKAWVSVAPEYRDGRAVLVVRTGGPMAKPVAPPKAPKHNPAAHAQAKPRAKAKPHAKAKPRAQAKPHAQAKPQAKAKPPRGKA
jgi:hypothetical protein